MAFLIAESKAGVAFGGGKIREIRSDTVGQLGGQCWYV
jgi:hypothetical protein